MTNPAKTPPITVPTNCAKGLFLSIIKPMSDAITANTIIFSRLNGKTGKGVNVTIRKVITLVKNPLNKFKTKSFMNLI